MRVNQLTEAVIGAAIEVHRTLGPGLLESAYESCLARELELRGLPYERQLSLPLGYKGVELECGYILGLLVEGLVVVELKTVEKLLPIHEAQLLTYLKLTNSPAGLLINFKESTLVRGLKRMVNNLSETSAPSRLRGSNQ
ncbi:MAG: GxxExxY protein [Azonexus sp.]|nr:GxxExxY protein [Azonexus sp.]